MERFVPPKARKLKEVCGDDFILVCPGVRPEWAVTGDQQRVMTPKQAFAEGADYLVIEAYITQAENPVLAWEKVIAEI